MAKTLYRSRTNQRIAGVCGGLGGYFDTDPAWLRIVFGISLFIGGLGLLTYLIIWAITPYGPNNT